LAFGAGNEATKAPVCPDRGRQGASVDVELAGGITRGVSIRRPCSGSGALRGAGRAGPAGLRRRRNLPGQCHTARSGFATVATARFAKKLRERTFLARRRGGEGAQAAGAADSSLFHTDSYKDRSGILKCAVYCYIIYIIGRNICVFPFWYPHSLISASASGPVPFSLPSPLTPLTPSLLSDAPSSFTDPGCALSYAQVPGTARPALFAAAALRRAHEQFAGGACLVRAVRPEKTLPHCLRTHNATPLSF